MNEEQDIKTAGAIGRLQGEVVALSKNFDDFRKDIGMRLDGFEGKFALKSDINVIKEWMKKKDASSTWIIRLMIIQIVGLASKLIYDTMCIIC